MTDYDNLPYAENGGFAPKSFRYFCVGLTVAMVASNIGHQFIALLPTFDFKTAAFPLAVLGTLILLHHAIRAAVHEAIRLADADDALDNLVLEQVAREANRTLTPSVLQSKVEQMS